MTPRQLLDFRRGRGFAERTQFQNKVRIFNTIRTGPKPRAGSATQTEAAPGGSVFERYCPWLAL